VKDVTVRNAYQVPHLGPERVVPGPFPVVGPAGSALDTAAYRLLLQPLHLRRVHTTYVVIVAL